MTLRHLDLFSGIGGFALAVRWLGHETVGFCEIDEWSRRVLDKHWPEVPKHDDIRTLKGTEFGPIDLVTGGFPCQPFSVAGERRGEDDARHLWPAMRRIIAETRPRFVLAENVPGIINMALDGVLADLEALGYTARAIVVPAGAVNALHRRDRVWIMAHADRIDEGQPIAVPGRSGPAITGERSEGVPDTNTTGIADGIQRRGVRAEPTRLRKSMADTDGRRFKAGDQGFGVVSIANRSGDGISAEGVGNALCERLEGEQQAWPASRAAVGSSCGAQAPRSMGLGPNGVSPGLVRDRWAAGDWENGISRVTTDEVDRRRKLMAAGNAIVPQVAYEILRVMVGEAA